jgi:hypothetical protein
MTKTDLGNPDNPHQDALDPRCDAIDAGLDAALNRTAPREIPEGLVERVAEASLERLHAGRTTTLRFRPLTRLAMAACVLLAVVAAFWIVGRQPAPEGRMLANSDLTVDVTPVDAVTGNAVARFRGLQKVSELSYLDALADLEDLVWAFHHGAGSRMVLSPGETNMEAVENELDSVRVVARLDG